MHPPGFFGRNHRELAKEAGSRLPITEQNILLVLLVVRALNMHMHTMCIRARSIHIMHSIHERTFKVTFAEPSAITSPPAKLLAISLRLSIVRILDFIFS